MPPINCKRLLQDLLSNLFIVNIGINTAGIWRNFRFHQLRRAARRQQALAALGEGAGPQDVIHCQAQVIDALSSRCDALKQLSDQQRSLLLEQHAQQQQQPAAGGQQAHAAAQQGSAASHPSCTICCDQPRDCALGCGHLTCHRCGLLLELEACPWCRQDISTRVKLFL